MRSRSGVVELDVDNSSLLALQSGDFRDDIFPTSERKRKGRWDVQI